MSGNGACVFDPMRNLYVVGNHALPRVSHILELAGLQGDYGNVPAHIRKAAVDKGTFVHEATALIDEERLDWTDLDPTLRPLCAAWLKFRETEPFEINYTESTVWTDRNGGFAGTLDRAGTWKGRRCVLDIKTGKKVYWPVRYQLALYVVAWLDRTTEFQTCGPGAEEVERRVVWLKDDGTYECPPPYADASDYETALAAVTLAHARLRHGAKLPASIT